MFEYATLCHEVVFRTSQEVSAYFLVILAGYTTYNHLSIFQPILTSWFGCNSIYNFKCINKETMPRRSQEFIKFTQPPIPQFLKDTDFEILQKFYFPLVESIKKHRGVRREFFYQQLKHYILHLIIERRRSKKKDSVIQLLEEDITTLKNKLRKLNDKYINLINKPSS